jgi:hypothetical protein
LLRTVPLLSLPQQPFNNPDQFKGCGGNSVWDLNEVSAQHSTDTAQVVLRS